MLRSACKPRKKIILFCALLAMCIAGIVLTSNGTQCTKTNMSERELSNEENISAEYAGASFGILENFTGVIPSDAELDSMTQNQIEDLYWRIDHQWDFDEDAARMFGCEVFCFDPSMRDKGETYKHAKDITFYMIGLGAKNEILQNQWKMRTLKQIRRDLNHTMRTIHILKIDIEGSEWTSIPQMVRSGTLHSVKQIQIELHGNGTQQALKVLRMLYEDGFKIFMRERNLYCKYSKARLARQRTTCMEVSMIGVTS